MPAIPAAPSRRLTASVLFLAATTIMANATIAPSLPGLKAHFADVAGIDTLAGLLLSLPAAAIVLTAGLFGWLADRMDRQRLLAFAALLYAIGGTSGLWAQTFPQMLIGRLVLGVGVAGTMTLAMAWAADLWQGPARARFMGLQGAAMSGGGIVVMLLGGALATLSWRGAFAVYALVVPIAIFALVMLAPHTQRINAARAIRAAAPVDAVTTKEAFPWAVFAFVGPLSLLCMATFYMMPTRLPFLLDGMGVKNTAAVGAIMASMTLAALPTALAYGRIRRYFSAMAVFAISAVLMAVGMALIANAQTAALVLAGTLVVGLGVGPFMPNLSTYFMGFVPPSLRGRASGLLTTAMFAGQFVSPLASAPLVARFGLQGSFGAVAFGLVVLAACLAVAAMAGRGRPAVA